MLHCARSSIKCKILVQWDFSSLQFRGCPEWGCSLLGGTPWGYKSLAADPLLLIQRVVEREGDIQDTNLLGQHHLLCGHLQRILLKSATISYLAFLTSFLSLLPSLSLTHTHSIPTTWQHKRQRCPTHSGRTSAADLADVEALNLCGK